MKTRIYATPAVKGLKAQVNRAYDLLGLIKNESISVFLSAFAVRQYSQLNLPPHRAGGAYGGERAGRIS